MTPQTTWLRPFSTRNTASTSSRVVHLIFEILLLFPPAKQRLMHHTVQAMIPTIRPLLGNSLQLVVPTQLVVLVQLLTQATTISTTTQLVAHNPKFAHIQLVPLAQLSIQLVALLQLVAPLRLPEQITTLLTSLRALIPIGRNQRIPNNVQLTHDPTSHDPRLAADTATPLDREFGQPNRPQTFPTTIERH